MNLINTFSLFILSRIALASASDSPSNGNLRREGKPDARLLRELVSAFTREDDVAPSSSGFHDFMSPGSTSALVDSFESFGKIDLTREEAESLCLTKCKNNSACKAVWVESTPGFPGLKDNHRCVMYDPELGPVAKSSQVPCNRGRENTIFTKKSAAVEIPDFDSRCNVPAPGDDTAAAVFCLLDPSSNPDCGTLVTNDFLQYILPAITCGSDETIGGGSDAVTACLECLQGGTIDDVNEEIASFCLTDPAFSRIRGDCREVCYENDDGLNFTSCEAALQTALLCDIASVNRCGGAIIDPPYVCPATDV